MKKLAALRQHLLDTVRNPGRHKIRPDQLLAFASNGRTEGQEQDHFVSHYTAEIIVTEYAGRGEDLLDTVRRWFIANEPAAAPDALQWDAELLDNEGVDIEFKLPLSERLIRDPDTNELKTCDDAVDMDALFGPSVPSDVERIPQEG